jgi:DTW domain-containing protein YfiP
MAQISMSSNPKVSSSPKKSPQPDPEVCDSCQKRKPLCICADLGAPFSTHLQVLILQHPQEPDKDLGTARLSQLQLKNCQLSVGLSWPNLGAAWEGKTRATPLREESFQPKNWVCIYLGNAGNLNEKLSPSIRESIPPGGEQLIFVDKKGNPLEDQKEARRNLQGILLLDGTWSQAKTLWWRNAWLLKCKRAALLPRSASLYGSMRKEPRKECLSTLESVALTLESLHESPEIGQSLRSSFRRLLQKARDERKTSQ